MVDILIPWVAITMIETHSLLRLQAWLSPSFPTGAFSYSHALEQAVSDNKIHDRESLRQWISSLVKYGTGWNDAVLLTESWRRSARDEDVAEVSGLAASMAFSRERHLETMAQGDAFMKAASAWEEEADLAVGRRLALPVAVGHLAGIHRIDLEATLAVFLQAFASNQIQAALRLLKIGQQSGVIILAGLQQLIIATASQAANTSLDDLGSASITADIAAMQHETLENRIFRS